MGKIDMLSARMVRPGETKISGGSEKGAAPHIPEGVDMRQETKPCSHHWMIETSGKSTSKGVCRFCGEERKFNNSPEASWAAKLKRAQDAKAASQLP